MQTRRLMTILSSIVLLSLATVATVNAQAWQPPSEKDRCPSRWGAGDERGSANHMSAAAVLRAAQWIRTGEVFELAHVLSPAMPFFGTRRFDITLKRTFMNPQPNRRGSNEELVSTELGQVGTQLDAFNHQTIGDSLYNCFKNDELATRTGFTKLGIEKVGMLMTRGVLLDIAALKSADMLPDTYEITVKDLQDALARQNVKLAPGDAILVYTGWSRLWNKDNARYVRTNPGIGIAAAEWLVQQNPMLVGSDNWSVEVAPNPDLQANQPVHQIMLPVHGVHLIENMRLEELAARRVYEFAFIVQPLKIQGGTGSTVAPVAIW